jgi:hypothetical protein
MSNILPAGREGRAPSSSTTHAAPAMLPDAGGILASRDDGNHGEHARTGGVAGDGESKGGANPPGGATCLRDIIDLHSELFAEQAHQFEAFFDRIAGQLAGRAYWAWASLPGLRHPDERPEGRPWGKWDPGKGPRQRWLTSEWGEDAIRHVKYRRALAASFGMPLDLRLSHL